MDMYHKLANVCNKINCLEIKLLMNKLAELKYDTMLAC